MKSLAPGLALLIPAAVFAAGFKIDHATVCSANLDAMRKTFTGVTNVPTEYGGPHSNHATEMAIVSFPDGSYLELMGIQPKPDPAAVAAHVWSKFLRNNAGPCAFALRVEDMKAEITRLKAGGIHIGTPEPSGRTRPDGTKISWETLDAGTGPRGSLLPFLIRDFTPREIRAFPGGKPTTTRFAGIGKVVVGVHDLDGAISQYRKAFGLADPRRQKDTTFDGELAWFQGTPFVLAKGLTANSWLTRRVEQYGDAPVAFVLRSNGGVSGGGPARSGSASLVVWMDQSQLGWRLGIEPGR